MNNITFKDKYNNKRILKSKLIRPNIIKDEYGSLWRTENVVIIKKESTQLKCKICGASSYVGKDGKTKLICKHGRAGK